MIQAALKNPYVVVVIALAIAVLGGIAYSKIPAAMLPQFETTAVQIVLLLSWNATRSHGKGHHESSATLDGAIVRDRASGSQGDVRRGRCEGFLSRRSLGDGTGNQVRDERYVLTFSGYHSTGGDAIRSGRISLVLVSNDRMNEQELYDIFREGNTVAISKACDRVIRLSPNVLCN